MQDKELDPLIGGLQILVMHFIWDNGPSTVHQVHDAINGASATPRAYTTILTVMRNLARRRILNQVHQGRSHVFVPLVTREALQKMIVQQVRDTYFKGDAEALQQALAADAAA
jgi:BlaI family transcriptional regulator, penicillinase repressor